MNPQAQRKRPNHTTIRCGVLCGVDRIHADIEPPNYGIGLGIVAAAQRTASLTDWANRRAHMEFFVLFKP